MFEEKPLFDEFDYFIIMTQNKSSPFVRKNIIKPALKAVYEEYKINVKEVIISAIKTKKGKIPYVAYGPINLLDISQTERKYLSLLSKIPRVRLNIITAYEIIDGKDSPDYNSKVEKIASSLTDELGVNIIFPDAIYAKAGLRSIDWEDLRDNIICETVRVKYNPIRISKKVPVGKSIEKSILQISSLIKEYGLWHRDTTDGAIMIKDNDSWLISQTKTNKTVLTKNDFSLIKRFDQLKKEIIFSGRKIPSSDSPELLLFAKSTDIKFNLLIHFHKNNITRNDIYKSYRTLKKLEYGKFKSGEHMTEEFKRIGGNWIILLEHGVVWVGNNANEFEEFISKELHLKRNN